MSRDWGVYKPIYGTSPSLWRCPTCAAATDDPDSHDKWHDQQVQPTGDAS